MFCSFQNFEHLLFWPKFDFSSTFGSNLHKTKRSGYGSLQWPDEDHGLWSCAATGRAAPCVRPCCHAAVCWPRQRATWTPATPSPRPLEPPCGRPRVPLLRRPKTLDDTPPPNTPCVFPLWPNWALQHLRHLLADPGCSTKRSLPHPAVRMSFFFPNSDRNRRREPSLWLSCSRRYHAPLMGVSISFRHSEAYALAFLLRTRAGPQEQSRQAQSTRPKAPPPSPAPSVASPTLVTRAPYSLLFPEAPYRVISCSAEPSRPAYGRSMRPSAMRVTEVEREE